MPHKNNISRAAALSEALASTCDQALHEAEQGVPKDHPAIKCLEIARLELRKAEKILNDTLRRMGG
jgi:hypothetical protein